MNEDDQLMIRLQGGEQTAFDELVERHQGALVGFFFRNTRDIQLAEDLTQETLLKVYRQSWDFLPVGRFRGWMFRIGRNLLIDNVRKRSSDALVKAISGNPEDESDRMARLASELISPDQQSDIDEIAHIVDELLGKIPENQRSTFTLHHYNGLSLPEVADAMNTSLSTTKSRLRLAKQKLRDYLHSLGITEENP